MLQYQKNLCEDGTEALLNEIYSALEKSVQIKNIELSEAVKQTKYKVSMICHVFATVFYVTQFSYAIFNFLFSFSSGVFLVLLGKKNEIVMKSYLKCLHINFDINMILFSLICFIIRKLKMTQRRCLKIDKKKSLAYEKWRTNCIRSL